MDEIISLAASLCGVEAADTILIALCEAARDCLALRLKEGVVPEDCGKAFPIAAAAIAAKGRREGMENGGVGSFTAGSVSLSVTQEGDRFTSAAMSLLEPWLRDSGFGFRRV